VEAFTAGLSTCRDRAMVLLMLLGGLRAAEVRSLRLADVDMGLRRVRVVGKGGKERIAPVDGAFFAELAAHLRLERPRSLATAECFVVMRGPTAGQPMTEAGMRRIFRTRRQTVTRVQPGKDPRRQRTATPIMTAAPPRRSRVRPARRPGRATHGQRTPASHGGSAP
jgi:integrase/recombinase XerC